MKKYQQHFWLFFTKNVYIPFNHLLSIQLTTLLTALCLVLLCYLLQDLWSVKHLSAHHAVQNDLNVHQKSWTDLIQCQFVLLLVDCLSENLVISKTDLIIFASKIGTSFPFKFDFAAWTYWMSALIYGWWPWVYPYFLTR